MKPSTRDHPRWIPPSAGVVKINVDAEMAKTTPASLVAAVARLETEVFLGHQLFSSMFVPETLEVMAVREGMNLAQDLALTCIKVTTDRLSVLHAMKEQNLGKYVHIIQEIKS
jgi:ribonuclease HI